MKPFQAGQMTVFTISYEDNGKPDSQGRRTFFLDWIDSEGRARGQIFKTNVDDCVRDLRRRGSDVVDKSGKPLRVVR